MQYWQQDFTTVNRKEEEMAKTELSQWAERFDKNTFLYELEHESDTTGLFKTQRRYGDGIPSYSYTTPLYHVWVNDRELLVTMNYREAYQLYCKWKGEMA